MTKHDQARIKATVSWIEEHTHKHRDIKLSKVKCRTFIKSLCDGDRRDGCSEIVTVGMLSDMYNLAGGL